MKLVKNILKRIIVLIVLTQIILSCIGSGSSFAYTKEEVAAAVGGFAAHVVDTYGKNALNRVGYRISVGDKNDVNPKVGESGHCRDDNPIYKSGQYTWDIPSTTPYIYFDCVSFAAGCYKAAAGIDLPRSGCKHLVDFPSEYQKYFEEITDWGYDINNLQTGDFCVWSEGDVGVDGGHAIIFVSSDKGFASNGQDYCFGGGASNTQRYVNERKSVAKGFHVFRITDEGASKVTNLVTDYATEFQQGQGGNGGGSIVEIKPDYSKFYFNGAPDGTYSLAERENIFQIIINAIKDLFFFLMGLIVYLIRGLIIAFISVFDRLLNNTVRSVNYAPVLLKNSGISLTNADDPMSMNRYISIEELVYNELDLFDVDIFKVEEETTEPEPEPTEP